MRIILFLFFLTFVFNGICQPGFIENKGQWNKNILYKMDIPQGALFLENNCLTYTFYKEDDVQRSHAHHDKGEPLPDNKGIVHFHSYKVKFGNTTAHNIFPKETYPDYSNYFIGNNKANWKSNVKRHKVVYYENLYNSIDFQMYINKEEALQYDFVVKPDGNPEDIRLTYEGQDALYVDNNGSLIVVTSLNKVTELKPYAYQTIDGKTIKVPCIFLIRNGNVAFQFPTDYDHSYNLIIDPVLVFSTYSGSTTDNWGFTATFDDQSNVFSGGINFSTGYPVTTGAYQVTYAGGEYGGGDYYGCDITIIKYDATGTQRLWATYLGGTISEELPHSLVCDRNGDMIIFGTTGSSDFPMGPNPYDNSFNGGTYLSYDNVIKFANGTDIFVAKISSDGTNLLGSTFIGGSENDGFNFRDSYNSYLMDGNGALYYNYADGARGEVICDGGGSIYVGSCTFSSNFPITTGSFGQLYYGQQEGVVFKLSSDLSQLLWSSYFGGTNDDAIYSLDLDNNQEVYIGGGTNSVNIPTTGGVYHPLSLGGTADGFIAHISSDGSTLIKSTYFGSSVYDQVYFVRVDKFRNIYVTGQTCAPSATLIYNASYFTPNSGQFITKFPNDLSSPIWSTVFGTGIGKPNISITAFSVDYCNRIYLAGWGREWAGDWNTIQGTKNMQVTSNAYQSTTDGQDFYLMVMADDASGLEYASFFGELHPTGSSAYCGHDHVDGGTSRFDKRGYIYESVCASCGFGCNGFPTYPNPGVWSPNNGGMSNTSTWICNNAVFKFSFELPLTIADFAGGPVCIGDTIHFTNSSQLATDYYWNFGDGTTSVDFQPYHVYTNPGFYNVSLIASHPTSCNLADSITRTIYVEKLDMVVHDTLICSGNPVSINAIVTGSSSNITYTWSHFNDFSDVINTNPNSNSITVNPTHTTTYYIHAASQICDIIDSITVSVYPVDIATSADTTICYGNQLDIHAYNQIPGDTLSYTWWPTSGIISGQNTPDILTNPAQSITYYVSVTNQHNCTKIDSVHISVDQFTLSPGPVQNLLCYNVCNGALSVYPNNGNAPYTYHWSNNDTTSSINGLCVGNYSVTVNDINGCSHSLPFTITQPPLLVATITPLTEASCDPTNPNTGSAVVTPSGGTPGYTYHWNFNQHDSLIINLYAGHYVVTVTDSNGCDTILSTDIIDPSNLQISTDAQDVLCFGDCNGNAEVSILTPGIPPYSYSWNTGDHSIIIDSLCSGTYWISVTDAEFCVRVQGVYVDHPDTINAKITTPGINCYGGSTSATGSVLSGGTPAFTYSWSTGTTGNPVTGLTVGWYWLYITDSHGCQDSTPFYISEPPLLTHDTTVTPVACTVACNGTIQVIPIGGTYPYQYNWSNGSHSSTLTEICSGNYSVTITDYKGCIITDNFNVGVSDYLPTVDASVNPQIIYEGQSSQLHATATAGTTYQFLWSPAGTLSGIHIPNPIATPTGSTTYTVTVQDAWGCSNIDTVSVIVMDVICSDPYIYVPNAFTPNNDGQNDVLYIEADMSNTIYFAIYDRWGELVFSTTQTEKGWDGTYKGKPLDPAVFVYYLKITCINKLQFEKKGNITLIR